jgi:glycolate oxidase subunit GlcD
MGASISLVGELAAAIEAECRPADEAREYLTDATAIRGLKGSADVVAFPESVQSVVACVRWCYEHGLPMTVRGGGTGYAGGAVPIDGGVVVSMERLNEMLEFDPLLWRIRVQAGVRTAVLHRLARESGLMFPPDPGAAEDSHVGGNIATNAGGPHAFKYGVTGTWVTGLEAVIPPGEVISVGGAIRKDQSGYDLKGLLIGSEGTLGIVTSAWLRLHPAPEAVLPILAVYSDVQAGCAALERILGSGLVPAAVEYLDGGALELAAPAYPWQIPAESGFLLLAEADGEEHEARRLLQELREAMEEGAREVVTPAGRGEIASLWRWREGISAAAAAKRGGKIGEDIVVPIDRLAEAIAAVREIGARNGLEAVTWGHAGDGNVHANFLVDLEDRSELDRAGAAAQEVFALAVSLGGSISGEHGLGWLKRGQLERQWVSRAIELHAQIKRSFDPKGLLNPGKKL